VARHVPAGAGCGLQVVPVIGRDTYVDGHGRLLVRPLDAVTVLDLKGEPMDAAELVTWLDDAILFAPGMLFGPGVTFSATGPTRQESIRTIATIDLTIPPGSRHLTPLFQRIAEKAASLRQTEITVNTDAETSRGSLATQRSPRHRDPAPSVVFGSAPLARTERSGKPG
jgi:hypothetical protein